MAWIDAMLPAEQWHRENVMRETWGHLAPKRNKSYRGFITFAIGCYDSGELNPTVLACELDELEDSPWLYDELNDWLQSTSDQYQVGCVYRFVGKFRNYQFVGETVKVFDSSTALRGAVQS